MDDVFGDLMNTKGADISNAVDGGINFRGTLKGGAVHNLVNGVTLSWLVQAFGMNRATTEKKLRGCPVLRTGINGMKVYDFRKAVDFLATPRFSVEDHINGLKPTELPPSLRSEIWSARLKEQKARLNAENLWLTEDVQAAFGEVFKQIKDTVILWTDTVEESEGLTDEQRVLIDELARELLSEVGNSVAAYCKNKKTTSQVLEFEEDLHVP